MRTQQNNWEKNTTPGNEKYEEERNLQIEYQKKKTQAKC